MKRTGKKVLWEGRHIRAVSLAYQDREGVERLWEAVERVNSKSVVIIIPVTVSGELVLIKQYRPALDRFVVEFPAGLVDDGESPIEAARRELIEETGYVTGQMVPLVSTAMSSGIHGEPWHVFLAREAIGASSSELSEHKPDDNEDIEVINVPLATYREALREMSGNGSLVDIRVFGLVELARAELCEP